MDQATSYLRRAQLARWLKKHWPIDPSHGVEIAKQIYSLYYINILLYVRVIICE